MFPVSYFQIIVPFQTANLEIFHMYWNFVNTKRQRCIPICHVNTLLLMMSCYY